MKGLILKIIKGYSFLSKNLWDKHCRFYPSCSKYSYLSIEKYGILKGSWKAIKRISKCHPWNKGGVDLP